MAAVAAVRAALGNELLAPERGRAVAALAGEDRDFGFIDEFKYMPPETEKPGWK
jgi:hypothetical protein